MLGEMDPAALIEESSEETPSLGKSAVDIYMKGNNVDDLAIKLELFKIFVNSREATLTRQNSINRFIFGIQVGLMVVIGFLFQHQESEEFLKAMRIILLGGIGISTVWFASCWHSRFIASYKLSTIREIEEDESFPIKPFKHNLDRRIDKYGETHRRFLYYLKYLIDMGTALVFLLLFAWLYLVGIH